MNLGVPGKVVASCFALAAFAVALLSGMVSDRPASEVLTDALLAMLVCYPAGLVLAHIAQAALRERLVEYVRLNPIPSASDAREVGVVTPAQPEGEARS